MVPGSTGCLVDFIFSSVAVNVFSSPFPEVEWLSLFELETVSVANPSLVAAGDFSFAVLSLVPEEELEGVFWT